MEPMVLELLEAWVQTLVTNPVLPILQDVCRPPSFSIAMESPSRTYSHYKFHINITLTLRVIISQFKKCLSFEVEAVKKAFATLAAKYNQPGA
jgi:hypothetical protein